jgi:hypothetical protein
MWNKFWSDLRKPLSLRPLKALRRRLEVEGKLQLNPEMRAILRALDGKRMKLSQLERMTGKGRKYLIRRDADRTQGPLALLLDEGLVVASRKLGYGRPDRPPRFD